MPTGVRDVAGQQGRYLPANYCSFRCYESPSNVAPSNELAAGGSDAAAPGDARHRIQLGDDGSYQEFPEEWCDTSVKSEVIHAREIDFPPPMCNVPILSMLDL